MTAPTKPPPDYWVVKRGPLYRSIRVRVSWVSWASNITDVKKFLTRDHADSVKDSLGPGARVVAVRRKPSVKTRIAELVANTFAAIDKRTLAQSMNDVAVFLGSGETSYVSTVVKLLDAIDPAAAAEIRAYWEAK